MTTTTQQAGGVLTDAVRALGIAAANEGRSGIPSDDLGLMELLSTERGVEKTNAMKAYRKAFFRRLMDVDMTRATTLVMEKPKTVKLPRKYDYNDTVFLAGAQRMAKIRAVGPMFKSKKWAVAFEGLSVELTVPKSLASTYEDAAQLAAKTINEKPWGRYLANLIREMQNADCGLSTETAHWIVGKAEGRAFGRFERLPAGELSIRVNTAITRAGSP